MKVSHSATGRGPLLQDCRAQCVEQVSSHRQAEAYSHARDCLPRFLNPGEHMRTQQDESVEDGVQRWMQPRNCP